MFKYEVKKVFFKTSSKIALVLLLIVTGVSCFLAMDVSYVNGQGEKEKGPAAISKLKTAQQEWAGDLNEEKIRKVIAENKRISETNEAKSNAIKDNEIAYSWGQGITEIRNLLNHSYAKEFRENDYYRADSLSEEDAENFYSNRVSLLTKWLHGEAKNHFSSGEKEYLINQYESLQTPLHYDYMKGWTQLFEFAPTIIMIIMLILGYLVAGIFSNEFMWKSDAIFFSSKHGRNKAVASKIKAGFCIVTVIYWIVILLYTAIILLYFEADGGSCQIQADSSGWKCFYNITVWQKYLLIVFGGYIGCLFISFLVMLVSAKTKSAVLAVVIPFVVIFIPSFLENINAPFMNKILGILPNQLLQTGTALNTFNVYSFGGKVIGAIPILFMLYSVLTVIICLVIYRQYRNKQIG